MSTSTTPSRRPAAKLVLAGVAVVGIGAALTTAAWTDNVFFSAQAETGAFNLQGSTDGVSFDEHDTEETAAIVVPADAFENLAPGDERSVDLWVRNAGTVPAFLNAPVITTTGELFAGGDAPVLVTSGITEGQTLAVGAEVEFTLTLTAPNWDGDAYEDLSGGILVQVAGASSTD